MVLTLGLLCLAATIAPGQTSEDNTEQATTAAEQVMTILNDGLTGHSSARFLSAFDAGRMRDFENFAGRVRTFFGLYENLRVHYQVAGARLSEPGRIADVTVNIELEGDDIEARRAGVSRRDQLQLTLARNDRGWKIVDIAPRTFFQ